MNGLVLSPKDDEGVWRQSRILRDSGGGGG